MIHLEGITFGYSKHKNLFSDLSLTLEPGHIFGLLGKNGAGKSSLIKNIAGLVFPQQGHIIVMGQQPRQRTPNFLQDLYFLPEEIDLPSLSVSDFIKIYAPFYPRFSKNHFMKGIEEFAIPVTGKLDNLSYGQKKKVLISFGLATNARVMLMDEPTNGLDIPAKSVFRKLVAQTMDSDRIILISTHQVRDLENLIDAVIVLENSKIILHQSLDLVSERLCFGTLPDVNQDTRVLYAEPSLRGYNAVFENSEMLDSRVNIEHLFQAAIENPDRIKSIFQS